MWEDYARAHPQEAKAHISAAKNNVSPAENKAIQRALVVTREYVSEQQVAISKIANEILNQANVFAADLAQSRVITDANDAAATSANVANEISSMSAENAAAYSNTSQSEVSMLLKAA